MKHIYLLFTITFFLFGTPLSVHATTTIPLETDDIFWADNSPDVVGDQLFGTSIAKGDINNDGFEDVVIGAPMYDRTTAGADQNVGRVSIVYGSASQWTSDTISSAITFTGENLDDYVGTSVAVVDIDDDGYDDIFIGAPGYGTTGAVYLIYGQGSSLSSLAVTDSAFRKFTGQTGGGVGNSLAFGGDINHDGADDILVGDQTINSSTGAVYIKYGKTDHTRFINGSFDSNDVKINGVGTLDYTSTSIAGGGDINNDNFDDILIGACECSADVGKAFIVYGSGTLDSTINLSSAITFTGEASNDQLGYSVSFVGDMNNDGFDEFAFGAPGNDSAFSQGGAAYLVYGKSAAFTSRAVSDSSVVKFSASRSEGTTGQFVGGGRDLNNDARPDLIVSTTSDVDPIGGRVHVMYGGTTLETNQSINTANDLVFDSLVSGQANYTGAAVVLGDWNGDGYVDISIGSPYQQVTLAQVGSVHTYYQRIDADLDGVALNTDHVIFDGTDCNDADISVSTTQTYYQDQDNDNSGSGISEAICQGTPSTGYRASVANQTDCNDTDAAVSVNQTYYQDADNDTIGSGITETICSATPSSGYRASVAGTNDCNDSDGTATANRTYYSDTDHDGLGSNDALLSCTATAPENYVSNSNDTNDSIANNGIEISGDGIDNDSDGVIDEVNTLASNGAHPAYKSLSITSSDDYKAVIQSVNPLTHGSVRVVFKDGSVYDYTIFTTTTSKKTLYTTIKNTARIVAVSENGKQIRTVNLFTGAIIDTKTGIKSKTKFTVHTLLLQDIRNDGSLELLVTSSNKKKHTYVTLTRIAQSSSIAVKARAEIKGLAIDTRKTKIHSTTLQLRNSARKVLKSFTITKLYDLKSLQ